MTKIRWVFGRRDGTHHLAVRHKLRTPPPQSEYVAMTAWHLDPEQPSRFDLLMMRIGDAAIALDERLFAVVDWMKPRAVLIWRVLRRFGRHAEALLWGRRDRLRKPVARVVAGALLLLALVQIVRFAWSAGHGG